MPMFSPFLPSISDKYFCTGYYCTLMVPLVLGRVSSHGVVSVQFVLPRLSHSTDMIVALRVQGLGLVYDVTTCQRNVKGAVHPADQWSDLRPSEQCIQRTSGPTSVPPSSASSGPVVRPPSLRAVHPADQWSDLRPSEQCIQRTSGQTSVPPSSASSGPVVRPPSLRAVHPADQWSDLRPSEQCIQRTSGPTSIPPSSASSGPVFRPPSLRAVHPADQWSDLHPSEQCIQRTSGPTSVQTPSCHCKACSSGDTTVGATIATSTACESCCGESRRGHSTKQ